MIIEKTLFAMAISGQTITKSTGISIALVLAIMAATAWITNAFNSTTFEIQIMQKDIEEIKNKQNEFTEYVKNQSLIIHQPK